MLDKLQAQQLITYTSLGRGKVVRFKVKGWRQHNTVLDYNAPCQKDSGFFFMPISIAADLISTEKCSDMDCVLDLWLNTIYNDEQVTGSDMGPVVYLRNGTDHIGGYIIPPNFIDSGSFFGGMFKARNTIEAGVLLLAVGIPVFTLGTSLLKRLKTASSIPRIAGSSKFSRWSLSTFCSVVPVNKAISSIPSSAFSKSALSKCSLRF